MRRSDREITDYSKMFEILKSCDCVRVGFVDEVGAYIVPLNFGYLEEDGKITLYFHGAKEGKKTDLMKEQPVVGFEMDAKHKVLEGATACNYTFLYQSIMGRGRIERVTEYPEQEKGLALLMEHYSGKTDWHFPPQIFEKMDIVKLTITEWTCKEHQ